MKMNKRKDVSDKSPEIAELYSKGASSRDLASLFGCSKPTIIKYMKKMGINIKTTGGQFGSQAYPVKEDFFKTPNQINSYWAGFICADGCVTDKGFLKISLKESDRDHLENFRDSISPTRPLHKQAARNGYNKSLKRFINGKPQVAIEIGSRKIVEDLRCNFKIHERKSLTAIPPENLSFENGLSFIVGYIDGDGSLGTDRNGKFFFHVVGTKEVLEFIREFFIFINPSLKISIKKVGKIFSMCATEGRIKFVLQKIYQEVDVPFMERKWKHALA